jgi:hypothetical protein
VPPPANSHQEPPPNLQPPQNLPDFSPAIKDIQLPSGSPYEIQRYLQQNPSASLKEIWQLLGIEEKNAMAYQCSEGCHPEIQRIPAGKGKAKLFLLKVGIEFGDYYEFFFFEKKRTRSNQQAEWKFWGSVDSSGQRYGPPRYRFIVNHDQPYFVLNELWGRGSDFALWGERWYELQDGTPNQIIAYPERGSLGRPDFDQPGLSLLRKFKAASVSVNPFQKNESAEIEYKVSYKIGESYKQRLLTKRQTARYVWNRRKREFILDEARSGLSEREMEEIYNAEGLDPEAVLQYNLRELQAVALRGGSGKKEWLRQFLENVADSSEKSLLQKALSK